MWNVLLSALRVVMFLLFVCRSLCGMPLIALVRFQLQAFSWEASRTQRPIKGFEAGVHSAVNALMFFPSQQENISQYQNGERPVELASPGNGQNYLLLLFQELRKQHRCFSSVKETCSLAFNVQHIAWHAKRVEHQ